MQIRVISSIHCPNCKSYLEVLRLKKIDHIIFDADKQENQKKLDEWFVTAMPVIQFVEGDIVLHQFPPGPINTRVVLRKFEEMKARQKPPAGV